jgi:hypothetical protein
MTEAQLREKLRKIEALFHGAATSGEKSAAEAALHRVRAHLSDVKEAEPLPEIQFSMPDNWSRQLFLALARRYGLKPYRRSRQRRTSVTLRTARDFVDEIFWPEFQELNRTLHAYLNEVTLRVIREEVHADTAEAPERA